MVTVTCLLVFPFLVHGAFARAQDPIVPEVVTDYYNAYDYGPATNAVYPDYYYPTTDYVKPSVAYGDYAKSYYTDYYSQYTDFAYNDYDYYQYYDEYGAYDDEYLHEYGDYFGFGDRNNPLETALGVYDQAAAPSELPWVYIIVPVLQVDLYYVDDEQKGIENIDFEPIETFLFELGDFGLGHFELGDFGLGELDFGNLDYPAPSYDYAYEDYPIYGHYPYGSKPQMFDTADELDDVATLDYPAVDYQPLWVDWIFMVPPENAEPVVR
ncbi:uncharacterized protein LOC128987549 isoform X2 [Macrosteles quadrilineatus]|uniref:uncharacterized protein LOC128987549 isoform X2 n=1 Tax=Macrosteles quadrilineatus TaxID=74068 RepID=UPI0023E16F65|nr:uncharacterized protein LOC128987549 isoform X2 [Macrosteles quadrilineatus]